MKKTFLSKMKKRLLQEKNEIIRRVSSENNQIDCDGDEADEIQANLLIYLDDQIFSRYKSYINRIDEALARIDRNEYGSCEECGEEIIEKRLEFNPHFTQCVICAEEKEKQARR